MEVNESKVTGDPFIRSVLVELPVCRWRGDVNEFLRVECKSNKISKPPEGVPPEICKQCSLADHEPADLVPASTPAGSPPAVLTCRHRGDVRRHQLCPSCRGAVKVKVFTCGVHGECSLVKQLDQVQVCAGCPDRAD